MMVFIVPLFFFTSPVSDGGHIAVQLPAMRRKLPSEAWPPPQSASGQCESLALTGRQAYQHGGGSGVDRKRTRKKMRLLA